ncbi:hypothetical protein BDZ89DRAFT_1260564 [Hymenopellis radicata]|nr:hypothetical protein BDZ89DRAFT_1260564 [Hymenopellis radicata]
MRGTAFDVVSHGLTPSPVPAHVRLSTDASDFRDCCLAKNPSERLSASELLQHRYLLPDDNWAFTQSEIQATSASQASHGSPPGNTEKALPVVPPAANRRRHSVQRSIRRSSISVPPPVDRGGQRHVLHKIESVDCLSQQATLLPGPPTVFITPPGSPASADTNMTSRTEGVFNWAATMSSTSSRATGPQRRKNFYVVNPDIDSDSEEMPDLSALCELADFPGGIRWRRGVIVRERGGALAIVLLAKVTFVVSPWVVLRSQPLLQGAPSAHDHPFPRQWVWAFGWGRIVS